MMAATSLREPNMRTLLAMPQEHGVGQINQYLGKRAQQFKLSLAWCYLPDNPDERLSVTQLQFITFSLLRD
jgi:hypothetical protein